MKLKLETNNKLRGRFAAQLLTAEPFIENSRGILIHRPRNVKIYNIHKSGPHIAVHYYCGSGVSGSNNITFLQEPPENKMVCQACENRAVMAGHPTSDSICGRHIHKGRLKAIMTCCSSHKRNID